MKLLKEGYGIAKLDDCHRHLSVKILADWDFVELAAEPLRMHYKFWVGGEPIQPAQEIKLRKIANITDIFVLREATFTDMMHSLLSYAWALEEDHGARLFYLHITDTVEDTMYSNYLAATSRATYKGHMNVSKTMIKHHGVPPVALRPRK